MISSIYEALVVDNKDPLGKDRVCIYIPQLDDPQVKNNPDLLRWSYIIRPVEYGTLQNLSIYTRPQIGSEVLVQFLDDDFQKPIIIGRLDKLKVDEAQSPKETIIKDPNGNVLKLKEDTLEITLVKPMTVKITGNLDSTVSGDVNITSNNATIKATKVTLDSTCTITGVPSAQFCLNGQVFPLTGSPVVVQNSTD